MNDSFRISTGRVLSLLCCAVTLSVATVSGRAQTNAPSSTPAPAPAAETAPAPSLPLPQLVGNKIELLAEQSEGGNLLKTKEGQVTGTTLDKSCAPNFKGGKNACIDWKIAAPLPPGWWHGVVESREPKGYANRDIAIMLLSKEKAFVKVAANFNVKGDSPQRFEFWIYTSSPSDGVRMQPDSDLWNWNRTWAISKITLEQVQPSKLEETDAVTLELPVVDGAIVLPEGTPGGNWMISGILKRAGKATFEGADGKTGTMPFTMDLYKKNVTRGANFYMGSPLKKITLDAPDLFPSVMLRRNVTRPWKPLMPEGELMTTVDTAKPVTGVLEMTGTGLNGEPPVFATFPHGKKIAVMTTWDDGPPEDLRCAEILNRLGYRPTFFLNHNSRAWEFQDKLLAQNVELGSHGWNHPFLYYLPPDQVKDECIAMRKFMETKLGHPVISYAFPNGYIPSYDVEGDYVRRGIEAAGYWSGRTTNTAAETVDTVTNPQLWKTDGFFGNTNPLTATWEKVKTKEGAIFYFWGHSWQIGKTDADWKKFEDFVVQFSAHPDAWYASQGEMSVWLWERKNVTLTVTEKSPARVQVQIRHPWVHPYLSALCPLALKVPAGVEKVTWQGKVIPVVDGRVDLPWGEGK